MNFNPLEHPICLQMPRRNLSSAWMEHTPFAMYLMDIIRPRVFVELGTFYGVSYCAFCQAVHELGLSTKCHAVDTWAGDAHMGGYDKGILRNLRQHHDPLYGTFSTLIKSTFDEAVNRFADGTIDLLHIDGYHTYEAVKHDFETWKPKLSRRGVVIFHDTNEHKEDFGVWRLLDELKVQYPHFEFLHGHGLGIVAVGKEIPSALLPLLNATENEIRIIREFFQELGQRVFLHTTLSEKLDIIRRKDQEIESLREDLNERFGRLFRFFERYRRLVRNLLPTGTRRRRVYDFLVKLLRLMSSPSNIRQTLGEKAVQWGGSAKKITQRIVQKTGLEMFQPPLDQKFKPIDRSAAERSIGKFAYKPLVSFVIPTYNTPPKYLLAAIRSVQMQYYENWELCICDNGSTNPKTLETINSINDDRIKIIFLEENTGISTATNRAVEATTGEFIAFLDHDDEITPDALYEMVRLLNVQPELDAIYSDQDKINDKGRQCEPFLKPDWSPEYFRSVMYIGHLLILRRAIWTQVGGLNPEFDGVQDYELMLRVSEQTRKIAHISKILYHWRMAPGSVALGLDEKGEKIELLQVKAVNEHFDRMKLNAEAIQHPVHHHRCIIKPGHREEFPRISIVIVGNTAHKDVTRCIQSISERTTYPNYEVLVAGTTSSDPSLPKAFENHPVRTISLEQESDFSHAANVGVQSASGEILVLMHNDTEIVTSDWLEQMVFYLDDTDIGAVGPKLLYPDETIQHAGIALEPDGTVNHMMRGFPSNSDGHAGSLSCPRNVSAVTGACLMMRRRDYLNIGGLSEYYKSHYQDVDLCLRLLTMGKRTVYVPYAVLIHYEMSVQQDKHQDHLDHALLMDTWGDLIGRGDPYHNRIFS